MNNPYKEMSDLELKAMYFDYFDSEEKMIRAESFVPYATDLKKHIGGDITLRETIEWAKRDFFLEVARRYFS